MSDATRPDAIVDEVDAAGFHSVLGYQQIAWEDGRSVLTVELQPHHMNLAGVIHGGVLTSLLDIAMALAGTYCPYPGRMRKAITLSLTTTFTGQARSGGITVTGIKRAGGSRIFNGTGEIHDADGQLLAVGEGVFRIRSGSEALEGVAIPGTDEPNER